MQSIIELLKIVSEISYDFFSEVIPTTLGLF